MGERAEEAKERSRFLLLRVGDDLCAVPVTQVRSISAELATFPVPGTAPALKGLARHASQAIPVLDLATLLGCPKAANPEFPVTVIVRVGGQGCEETLGLLADEAVDIVTIDTSVLIERTRGVVRAQAAVGDRVAKLIDLGRISDGDRP
jgi:chemotaxis signal transduction protein